jgi:hypothetical protein
MHLTKRQLTALLGAGASAYLWFKAAQKFSQAADEREEGGREWHLLLSGLVAVAAVVVALRSTNKAVTKMQEAFPGPADA